MEDTVRQTQLVVFEKRMYGWLLFAVERFVFTSLICRLGFYTQN